MINLPNEIAQHLMLQQQRSSSTMLRCSSHLTAPIRHTQLYYSEVEEEGLFDLQSSIRLMTGTMWHSEVEKMLKGRMVITEVNLQDYLPGPWTGTADFLEWCEIDPDAWVVNDLKTIKPEGIAYLNGEPKEEHRWQVSAYAMGAANTGIPVAKFGVVHYLPLGIGADPVSLKFPIIPSSEIALRMGFVYGKASAYKRGECELEDWPQPEARLFNNKNMGVVDVKMVPHWTSMYCPWPISCGCSKQKAYKIGHFEKDLSYVPRKGYEDSKDFVLDKFHADEVERRFR